MKTLFAAALAAMGVALAIAVVAAGSGGADPLELEPIGATTPVTTSTEAPNDVSGPCDEAEHGNDPRCAGVGAAGDDGENTGDDDINDDDDDNNHDDDDDRSGSNSGRH